MGHCMGIITLKMKVENGYIILIFTLMVVLHLFNSTYEDWYSFKNNQFHEWIGKAEWLHSDRWSAAYDWVYDGKFADVDIPDDIINCLVEEWEKSMGLKVGI